MQFRFKLRISIYFSFKTYIRFDTKLSKQCTILGERLITLSFGPVLAK